MSRICVRFVLFVIFISSTIDLSDSSDDMRSYPSYYAIKLGAENGKRLFLKNMGGGESFWGRGSIYYTSTGVLMPRKPSYGSKMVCGVLIMIVGRIKKRSKDVENSYLDKIELLNTNSHCRRPKDGSMCKTIRLR